MTPVPNNAALPIDQIKDRYVDEIRLRGYDDRYIDRNEEREILQIAIHQGIGLDLARAALAEVCEREGYLLESTLLGIIRGQFEAAATTDSAIDQAAFESIFQAARATATGRKNDREIKRLMVTFMEDHALNKVKTGWFHNWYSSLKRDLGLS